MSLQLILKFTFQKYIFYMCKHHLYAKGSPKCCIVIKRVVGNVHVVCFTEGDVLCVSVSILLDTCVSTPEEPDHLCSHLCKLVTQKLLC